MKSSKTPLKLLSVAAGAALLSALNLMSAFGAPLAITDKPLFLSDTPPPLNMLVMSRDHRMYYEAYNDASDISGDGVLDTTYGATATPGRTWFDVGGLGDNGRAIVLSDERPVLLGGGSLSSGQQDAVIAVLSVNGLPLTSFGSPYGCTAYDFGTVGDFFWAGAVARDGKIAAVGLTGHGTGSTDDTDGIFVLIDKP